jgi:hypothetical protein
MITREFLNANHASLVAEILAEGRNAGVAEGRTAGAEAERARIKDVEAQSMPGHEQLIAGLKYDGKTTAAEAAVQVLAAEKATLAGVNKDLKADAPNAAAASPTATGDRADQEAAAEAQLPPEERAKKRWDRDERLRAEYGDDFKAYMAFEKANAAGRVKILGAKQAA